MYLNFGAPIHFDSAPCSETEVKARVEQVKDSIRDLIDAGLNERTRIF